MALAQILEMVGQVVAKIAAPDGPYTIAERKVNGFPMKCFVKGPRSARLRWPL